MAGCMIELIIVDLNSVFEDGKKKDNVSIPSLCIRPQSGMSTVRWM